MFRFLTLCGALGLALMPHTVYAAPARGAVTRVAAADTVSCTVRSMQGLAAKGGIDKRLKLLNKQLSKPPFSLFKTIRLVEARKLSIAQGASSKTTLPDGKVLSLTFKEKLLVKSRLRLRMFLTLAHPRTKKLLARTVYSIADGGTFLLAGAKFKGGTMIVGVTCKAR